MAVEDDDISALLFEPSVSDVKPVELSNVMSTVFSGSASLKSDEKTAELSLEVAAWVDSCLAPNPELSDDNWSAVREALLEALHSYPTSDETQSTTNGDRNSEESSKERDDEGVQTSEDGEPPLVPLIDINEYPLSEDVLEDEDANSEASGGFHEDIESRENIFKVWDLEMPSPDEDDEFIQQLNKLISVSSEEGQQLPPVVASTPLSQEQVDELAAGMGDLSLQPFDN